MESLVSINTPELLEIACESGAKAYGGDQDWFSTRMMRGGGCASVAAANLLAYGGFSRAAKPPFSKSAFLAHMDDVGKFIYPGFMGTMQPRFIKGLSAYLEDCGFKADIAGLELRMFRRAPLEQTLGFIREALMEDCPVAWLNHSNGRLKEVESWHWVNITAIDGNKATVYDAGKKKIIDIALWHQTSLNGGGLVCLRRTNETQ